jgi:hypothetical protein
MQYFRGRELKFQWIYHGDFLTLFGTRVTMLGNILAGLIKGPVTRSTLLQMNAMPALTLLPHLFSEMESPTRPT